jgi:hypothetical protein
MIEIFIGYDPRDHKAFRVCETSILSHASEQVKITPLLDHECRKHGYARPYRVEPNGQMIDTIDGKPFSTQFSFTRFMVPHIAGYRDDLVVFCDADMLWRADVVELVEYCRQDKKKSVWCVQHQHNPTEAIKMDGVLQTTYRRKNWSSLVVWNPSKNQFLTPQRVSELPGSYLHAFNWLEDGDIGDLPEWWNWLAGVSSEKIEPSVVHYTLGTPDFAGYENSPYAQEWRKVWSQRTTSELERTGWS